ncbi:hypothetical protein [Rhizobium leguminosarum]|uniref:hypothetical protein n=1 Tax=Rhizobium leguminosarum TaxID=384 RepID=UPI00103A613F|nr:hypothetical protein [Rhizobium leguminosarum]TBY21461.1 hypothetical protein E0H30_14655 [Rhizobium leguminosarum bv. viciae]TBY31064.1 hypothetical protein E0H37_09430 [Rhizobium leguminosarum bv. viciae]
MKNIPTVEWSPMERGREKTSWQGRFGEYGSFRVDYYFSSDEVEVLYIGSYEPLQSWTNGGRQKLGKHYGVTRWKDEGEDATEFAFRYGAQTVETAKHQVALRGGFEVGLLKALTLRFGEIVGRLRR